MDAFDYTLSGTQKKTISKGRGQKQLVIVTIWCYSVVQCSGAHCHAHNSFRNKNAFFKFFLSNQLFTLATAKIQPRGVLLGVLCVKHIIPVLTKSAFFKIFLSNRLFTLATT